MELLSRKCWFALRKFKCSYHKRVKSLSVIKASSCNASSWAACSVYFEFAKQLKFGLSWRQMGRNEKSTWSLCKPTVEDEVRFKKVHSLTKSCVASGFFESSAITEAVALTSVADEKGDCRSWLLEFEELSGCKNDLKLMQAYHRTGGRLSKLIARVRYRVWL